MSVNDLVRRGDVEKMLCNAYDYDDMIDEGELAYLISEEKKIPAVPQEMSAREFLHTLQRRADAGNYISVMKFVGNDWLPPPDFSKWVEDAEEWAQEHPERSEE